MQAINSSLLKRVFDIPLSFGDSDLEIPSPPPSPAQGAQLQPGRCHQITAGPARGCLPSLSQGPSLVLQSCLQKARHISGHQNRGGHFCFWGSPLCPEEALQTYQEKAIIVISFGDMFLLEFKKGEIPGFHQGNLKVVSSS